MFFCLLKYFLPARILRYKFVSQFSLVTGFSEGTRENIFKFNIFRTTLFTKSKVTGYADDITVYFKAKSLEHLKMELQSLGNIMVGYCVENGLVLNSQKTQLLTNARKNMEINIDHDIVRSIPTISLLGLEYDVNFFTAPYLHKLARETKTHDLKTKLWNAKLSSKVPCKWPTYGQNTCSCPCCNPN